MGSRGDIKMRNELEERRKALSIIPKTKFPELYCCCQVSHKFMAITNLRLAVTGSSRTRACPGQRKSCWEPANRVQKRKRRI